GYSSALVPFGDSISRIRELENFVLRAMENVDFSIELVRIREFDGSGGSIELSTIILLHGEKERQARRADRP
ncbi:MAG: hypothetical protein IJS20_04840, partial [Bacteroidales bacterium]|nr:hypothetical protein [Bacteroidales bacterium]